VSTFSVREVVRAGSRDGPRHRVEVASTEPGCVEAVLHDAERLDVSVHRFSQASGAFISTAHL
jgi:hypothetical protein